MRVTVKDIKMELIDLNLNLANIYLMILNNKDINIYLNTYQN